MKLSEAIENLFGSNSYTTVCDYTDAAVYSVDVGPGYLNITKFLNDDPFDPAISKRYSLRDDSPVATDMVNHPPHYTAHPSGVECIELTRHMTFSAGNAVKYLWRSALKNGVEDIKKAIWYLKDLQENSGQVYIRQPPKFPVPLSEILTHFPTNVALALDYLLQGGCTSPQILEYLNLEIKRLEK